MQHIIIAQCHVHSGNAGQCGACWLDVNVRIVNDPSWLCILSGPHRGPHRGPTVRLLLRVNSIGLAPSPGDYDLQFWLWLWLTFRHINLLHSRSLLVITSLCCHTLSSQSRLQLRR